MKIEITDINTIKIGEEGISNIYLGDTLLWSAFSETPVAEPNVSTLAQFSTRRVNPSYNGPLFRLRNGTTNAEQDFTPDVNGNIVRSEYLAFANGSDCFRVTWYDQNTVQKNLTSSTSEQPKFYFNGLGYNRHGFDHNGTQWGTITGSQGMFNALHSTAGLITLVAKPTDGTNAALGLVGNNGNSAANIGMAFFFDDRNSLPRKDGLAATVNKGTGNSVSTTYQDDLVVPDKFHCLQLDVDPDNGTLANKSTVYVNYMQASTVNTANQVPVSTNATYNMQIGAVGNNVAPFVGIISEVFIQNTNASRFTLADNIGKFYGVNPALSLAVDGRYNSFGNGFLVPYSTPYSGIPYRSGTSHTANGRIDFKKYYHSPASISAATTVATPAAGKDYRDPKGGVVGGEKIMIFTTLYTTSGGTFDSMGYFLSTDLTGSTWSGYTQLTRPAGMEAGGWITYGGIIETDTPNEYYACAYGANGSNYKVWLWKIVYNAGNVTVSIIEVYSGTTAITESDICRVSANKYIIISRVNGRNILVQFTSTDGGLTWSAPVDTDMGAGGVTTGSLDNMGHVFVFKSKVWCFYQDRVTGYLMLGKKDIATALDNATWNPVKYQVNTKYPAGTLYLGYPFHSKIPNESGKILLGWCHEWLTAARSDIKVRVEDFKQY